MTIVGNSFFRRDTVYGKREIQSYETDDFGSIPQIVYKYLDLSIPHNFKSLTDNYFWFSDPTTFNDPFDCRASFAYHLLTEDESTCRKYFEFNVQLEVPDASDEEKQLLINQKIDWMLSNKGNTDLFVALDNAGNQSKVEGLKQFGVFCTCMINDNILLWSHYANKHTGICVGLKTDKLLEKEFKKREMGFGEVKYNDYPLISPPITNEEISDSFKSLFLNKAPFWNYELEYRFVDYPCSDRKKSADCIIETIYMGCDISEENEIFVKTLCKKLDEKIILYKAEKSFLKYEIEFTEVLY